MPQTVEYLDWSDRGLELYESGSGNVKYAEIDFVVEDETNNLHINLRRNTKSKRDLTIVISDPKALYELLKERFGDE